MLITSGARFSFEAAVWPSVVVTVTVSCGAVKTALEVIVVAGGTMVVVDACLWLTYMLVDRERGWYGRLLPLKKCLDRL